MLLTNPFQGSSEAANGSGSSTTGVTAFLLLEAETLIVTREFVAESEEKMLSSNCRYAFPPDEQIKKKPLMQIE